MESRGNEKLQVAVLFGGQSTEHAVSLCSSINIIRAIDRQKYDLTLIGISKEGRWILCDEQDYLRNSDDPAIISLAPSRRYLAVVPGQQLSPLIDLVSGMPLPLIDVAFSVLHGASGEDGSVQGVLRVLNIPYAGSDVMSSAVCMDKDMTKRVLHTARIPMTPSMTLYHSDTVVTRSFDAISGKLGLPLFIKPASQGSSVGVSKITSQAGFDAAVELAFQYDTKILVEKAIIGREIEVAVLGNNAPKLSVCGEILTHDEFYTYHTKYLKAAHSRLEIPAKIEASVSTAIREIARHAYLALGCRVMARMDFFLTQQGQILLNEVNTLPGFTSMSMYPKLWEASGLDYPALVERLITLALAGKKT
ncbi:D-alanine--D-alanine ligase [Candidatus Steffania adelgidicola]|uniref:D-alanine--D-alanine ligase n=1 Tax=Candidatus Steffania adelgidicola TaxID=1076626 RepID=UPI001D011D5C|nr:D-alanine--D-alanine ligase [Candidatus Steffania adelgidicola]UDG79979.1 D-alanine--D-alanine ligase A [Candidatus Steffania adelgidicola]